MPGPRTHGSRLLQVRQKLALDTAVTVRWSEPAPGTGVTVDPVTGSRSGTLVEKSINVMACIHLVDISMARRVAFTAIQMGDAIADFAHDAPLDGANKVNLRFEFGGSVWVQRDIGEGQLAQAWDALVEGRRVTRTVALRKAT